MRAVTIPLGNATPCWGAASADRPGELGIENFLERPRRANFSPRDAGPAAPGSARDPWTVTKPPCIERRSIFAPLHAAQLGEGGHPVAHELRLALEPEEECLGALLRGWRRLGVRPAYLHNAVDDLEINAEPSS